MVYEKSSETCCSEQSVKYVSFAWRPPLTYSALRVGLALLVIILAESIIESYAQFWTSNYDSLPLDTLTEDTDIVNALMLTLAALIASLVCFPLIGWLAVVKQSPLLANYFATMSVAWAIYVVLVVDDMPLSNMAFVSSLGASSILFAFKLHHRPSTIHDKLK